MLDFSLLSFCSLIFCSSPFVVLSRPSMTHPSNYVVSLNVWKTCDAISSPCVLTGPPWGSPISAKEKNAIDEIAGFLVLSLILHAVCNQKEILVTLPHPLLARDLIAVIEIENPMLPPVRVLHDDLLPIYIYIIGRDSSFLHSLAFFIINSLCRTRPFYHVNINRYIVPAQSSGPRDHDDDVYALISGVSSSPSLRPSDAFIRNGCQSSIGSTIKD